MERKYYLDRIRWGTVLLVLVYHVFYLYNAEGVFGSVHSFAEVQYQDALLYVVYPWFMALLFLVAGISSRYALMHRSHKQFLKERTVKLLVPSTLGLFAFQWMVGYFYIQTGGGVEAIPVAIRYPIMAVSGTGPLWFAQTLWLFALLLVLVRKLDRQDRFYEICGKTNTVVILLCGLLLWGSAQILNMPVLTTYRFGIYGMTYFLGYFVFSHEEVMERIEKMRLPMLCIAIGLCVGYVWHYFGTNYTESACLKSLFTNVYAWVAILAILGCGKAWWNVDSKLNAYMTKASFGIYVVHYLVALMFCYGLVTYVHLPVAVTYVVAVCLVLVCSPLLYEILRRIPILRYCVLGIKK